MKVVLNDKSLDGQFKEEHFYKYMKSDVIPCLELINQNGGELLKKYDVYNCMITSEKKLYDFLKIQGDPIINSLKLHLVQLANYSPFWEEDSQTRENIIYRCLIEEIPNCITEAFERQGIVFSFEHLDYRSNYFQLECDGVVSKVINTYRYDDLRKYLIEQNILHVWDKNSFAILDGTYKFEVRFNEGNHNLAHFHITKTEYSASVSIPDADVIEGNFSIKDNNKIVAWALRNMKDIVEVWNRLHPEKSVVA